MGPLTVAGVTGAEAKWQIERKRHLQDAEVALERLSTGKRINAAKDDPSGLVAAEQLRGIIANLEAHLASNTSRELDHANEDAKLAAIEDLLINLKALLTTASDGFGYNDSIDYYIHASVERVNRLGRESTRAPSLIEKDFANYGDASLAHQEKLAANLEQALASVIRARQGVAGGLREFESENRLIEGMLYPHMRVLSLIEDTDYAKEMSRFVRARILGEASTAVMAYASQEKAQQITELIADLPDNQLVIEEDARLDLEA